MEIDNGHKKTEDSLVRLSGLFNFLIKESKIMIFIETQFREKSSELQK